MNTPRISPWISPRIIAALGVTALTLTGCAQLPTAATPTPGDGEPLVVEPVQANAVVEAAGAVLQGATDPATVDLTALATRVSGPELEFRTAAHTIATAGATPPATGAADDYTAISSILPRDDGFPRWFATVTDAGADQAPSLVVFRTDSARDPYTVWASPSLLPGAALPTLAAPADGVATVAADEDTNLPAAPRTIVDHYADVLTNGDSSEFVGEFGADAYRDGVQAAVEADTSAVEGAGGTFEQDRTVVPDSTLAVRTRDGGALVVAAYTWTTVLGIPDRAISGTLDPAFAALAGRDTAQTTTVERRSVVVFSVPPGQGAVQLIALESGLVSVTGE